MKMILIVCAVSAPLLTLSAQAVDPYWLRMWEQAQRSRPAALSTSARIAPEGEPGRPLVIRGRVVLGDGVTPAPETIVFAYQTDSRGVYHPRGNPHYRLRGWARTDRQGRFEFRTIRPAAYPGGSEPQHVHFTIESRTIRRRWTRDLQFADDPLVSREAKAASVADGVFGAIRPVRTIRGVQFVDFTIRVEERGFF